MEWFSVLRPPRLSMWDAAREALSPGHRTAAGRSTPISACEICEVRAGQRSLHRWGNRRGGVRTERRSDVASADRLKGWTAGVLRVEGPRGPTFGVSTEHAVRTQSDWQETVSSTYLNCFVPLLPGLLSPDAMVLTA